MRLLFLISNLFILFSISLFAVNNYALKCPKNLVYYSEQIMFDQVGVKEATGKNDGEQVEKYQSVLPRMKRAPYCQLGQLWCFVTAADALSVNYSKIPMPMSAIANHTYDHAAKIGQKKKFSTVDKGFLVWRKDGSWSGHIERIYAKGKGGWVYTVGFNTSNGKTGSQHEGNGVFKRKRNIYHPLGRMRVRGIVEFDTEVDKKEYKCNLK